MTMEFKQQYAAYQQAIEQYLEGLFSQDKPYGRLQEAMRYSILGGGKRIRPVLTLEFARLGGIDWHLALPYACALELVHNYSLIHDDLPCMDNDDYRRGRLTNHKIFGEGMAVLAGDALLTEAFAVIAQVDDTERYTVRDYVRELAATGGSTMLIGGQILDLEGEHKQLSEPEVRAVYEGKTAALLTTALRFGAMSANATEAQLEAVTDFGYNLGLAFQVIDDILDLTASTEKLGKTAGKDVNAQKSTCPALIGMDGARSEAKCRTQAALDALMIFPEERRTRLVELANYLLNREY